MPLNNFGTCGPHLRCAQPDANGFDIMDDLGVVMVLKLNTNDEFPDAEETRLFSGRYTGKTIWSVPLNSFKPDEVQIRQLIRQIQGGPPLLIHCTHGRDRTGFVCAAYRIIVEGWDFARAWDEMKQYGWTPFSSLTDHAIKEVLQKLGVPHA